MGPFNLKSFIIFAAQATHILLYIILLIVVAFVAYGLSLDTVYFDGTDGTSEASTSVPSSDPYPNKIPNYENSSKWYVERMKMAHDLLMEHESKWLESEKAEYENTKDMHMREGRNPLDTEELSPFPENSLHANIAEFREQDAKEMLAINEALNKFYLNENPNDIGSSDNKRSTVEEDQLSVSEENKKSRIVAENETNVDNVTKKM